MPPFTMPNQSMDERRMLEQDEMDRDCQIEVVYIHAYKSKTHVECDSWYAKKDGRNKTFRLPGNTQTKNCGLVYALREVLKQFRKKLQVQDSVERPLMVFVKTDATYISDGVTYHLPKWSQSNWCNAKHKPIANSIFWRSVHHELDTLKEELDVPVKVFHCKLPLCLKKRR